ncbi:hypothetical protein [Burkholderia ubonensis]|uniref:hypothetical protein n=1 Tax=Burkholderia ubonensis TaxID=101571 RepID=UPI00075C2ACB|nr:hypothetical protein [Burkholderia ubonensis]KWE97880.1 hypothetical protein WL81_02285 [Burkholderia ubonensis]
MKRIFLFMFAFVVLLAGCEKSTPPAADSLVGVYGADLHNDGKITPLLKVEKGDTTSGYVLYEYSKGEWHRPKKAWVGDAGKAQDVLPFTKADLEKLVNHPVDVDPVGIQTKGTALVRVPAGWSDNGRNKPFTTKTGYFAMTFLGPVELQRM